MQKIKDWITKYYEGLAYLFFGGIATLLNLVIFAVFQAAFGTGFATGVGNILDNILCILFAYWTNRTFVFRSKNHGRAALMEFGGSGHRLCGGGRCRVGRHGPLQAVGHGRQAVQPGGGHPVQLCVQQTVHLQEEVRAGLVCACGRRPAPRPGRAVPDTIIFL